MEDEGLEIEDILGGIGMALIAISVAIVLIGVWWWAVVGISSEIGIALGVTAGICFFIGFITVLFVSDF